MAAGPVRIYELQDIGLLFGLFVRAVAPEKGWIVILSPTQRRMMHLEIIKDLIVKAVLADQVFMDPCEEQPALRPLYYSMIVGARHGHRLADAELRQRPWRHCLILGRILDRTR